jgi:hypothetical protein
MVDTGGDRRVYVRAIELHRMIVFARVRVQGARCSAMWQGARPGRDQSRERGFGTARSAHAPGSVRGVGYYHPSTLSFRYPSGVTRVRGSRASTVYETRTRSESMSESRGARGPGPHMLATSPCRRVRPPAALGCDRAAAGSLGPAVSSLCVYESSSASRDTSEVRPGPVR